MINIYKLTDFAQEILLQNVKSKGTSVDFTLGRGNDAYFLSKHFEKVYAFDIQKECIDDFSQRNITNVQLILDNNANIDKYINFFDCGMYNLGYLPKGNKNITTEKEDTLCSISKALNMLNVGGYISVILYIGHKNGKDESDAILDLCSKLNNKIFNVSHLNLINKNQPPSIVLINKIR